MSHSHSHTHDDHAQYHNEHDHEDHPDVGEQQSLYGRIDRDNVRCLNESVDGAGRSIILPWNERMQTEKFVESDADPELIFFIPFTGSIKLRSICIRTFPTHGPSKLKVFINRDDVDFDSAGTSECIQEWELVDGSGEVVEYGTRIAKFYNVRNITLYFPENFGEETTRIAFLGFKGEWTEIRSDPIITVYELNANPADHAKTSEGMDYVI